MAVQARVTPLETEGARHGESPVWDRRDDNVYWLDQEGPRIFWADLGSGEHGSWAPPRMVSAIAPRAAGGFIASSMDGFVEIDPRSAGYRIIGDPRADPGAARFNDGVVDRLGRYWSGTVDNGVGGADPSAWGKSECGQLFRLDPDGRSRLIDVGFIATNGPAFSPDGRTLYLNDTLKRVTYAYDIAADGEIANRRVFLRFDDDHGYPDGMTCDAEGGLWIAFFGDRFLRHYAPDATPLAQLELPVSQATRPTFGGERLDRLFLSTASLGFDEAMWAREPLAGALLEVHDLNVRGVEPFAFGG